MSADQTPIRISSRRFRLPNSPLTRAIPTLFCPWPADCASLRASKATTMAAASLRFPSLPGFRALRSAASCYTLELLGYVERTRQVYRLKTQVLRLGFSFLSSSSVVEAARPILERITEQLHESFVNEHARRRPDRLRCPVRRQPHSRRRAFGRQPSARILHFDGPRPARLFGR